MDPVTASILVGGGTSLLGGLSGNRAARDAARQQREAAAASLAENQRQFNIGQQNLAPWLRSGRAALGEQTALMGLGGDTEGAMRSLQTSPGYQFRMNQGENQLNSGLAARGGMGSGKGMVAGQRFAQGFASNEYGNRLSQLANMSGAGQQTAGGMANLGSQFGQNQGNIMQNSANAQGAAGIAGANNTQSSLLGGVQAGLGMYNAMTAPNNLSSLVQTPNWNQPQNDTWMQQRPYGQT